MKAPLARPYNFRQTGKVGTWYNIKNLSNEVTEIYIYDEIGYYGVTAADFVAELNAVNAGRITLRINSPGGDVFDGLAILNALRQHAAIVDVVIDGIAASAASFIAMAGNTVLMSPQSMMMIHDGSGLCMGNANDMREMADLLDKTSDNIAAVYAKRTGKSKEEWREAMLAETWYSDEEAVQAGLADGIVGVEQDDPESDDTEAKPVADAATNTAFDFSALDIKSLVKEAVTCR
jgi:ATP-dependent Clp endopeptidase proteolytic subunit ClpP